MNHVMSWLILAFQVKVIKLGTNVGLNMLINTSCAFVTTTNFSGDFFFLKIGKTLV